MYVITTLALFFFFFFFQAEDGIRDYKVTGVQTCALPISTRPAREPAHRLGAQPLPHRSGVVPARPGETGPRRARGDRCISLAPRSPAGTVCVRPRARLALAVVRDRRGGSGAGRRVEELGPGARSWDIRPGAYNQRGTEGRMAVTVLIPTPLRPRSEEHTSELQSPCNLVCRLLLEKKKKKIISR